MKKRTSRLLLCAIFAGIAALLLYLGLDPTLSSDRLTHELLDTVITRGICSVIFLLTLIELGSIGLLLPRNGAFSRRTSGKSLLFCLPWLAIAVNNLPILPLLSRTAKVDADAGTLLLFALGCFFVGVFEELAFRGVIFLGALKRFGTSPRGVFLSIVITSAVFGLFHLANLLDGADPGGVLLQIGYSFLIGGMCAIALLKTGSLWPPILLHALYNFNGYLVPKLGSGEIWTAPSIALTAAVAVAVLVYTVYILCKLSPEEIERCVS